MHELQTRRDARSPVLLEVAQKAHPGPKEPEADCTRGAAGVSLRLCPVAVLSHVVPCKSLGAVAGSAANITCVDGWRNIRRGSSNRFRPEKTDRASERKMYELLPLLRILSR